MVGSITGQSPNIVYGNNPKTMDKVTQEQLYNPGLYALQDLVPPQEKEKGGFVSFVAKTIITLGLVGGAAIAARKFIPALKAINVSELPAEAGRLTKAKYAFAKYTDKLNEGICSVADKCKNLITSIKKSKETTQEA